MRRPVHERQAFTFELGHLVRTVQRLSGGEYTHRCSVESYRAVARFIEENAGRGVTSTMLWEAEPGIPCTQASVALAFLKERGCVVVRPRRVFPASNFLFEDALVELYALEYGSDG